LKLTVEYLSQYQNCEKEFYHTALVGTSFVKEVMEEVQTGDFGYLEPELNNKYDTTAVAVYHDKTGERVGYIKRELNSDVFHNIKDKGELYVVKFEATGGKEGKEARGLNVEVCRFYQGIKKNKAAETV
jgi:hypothetical protein